MTSNRNNFDALRLTGALLVLVSHQFALAGRPEPQVPGNSWGGIGLTIFFSVSGYLVTASWFNDPHVLRFASRRLLRIWPGLALVVLISAAVASLVPGKGHAAVQFLQILVFRFQDGDFFSTNPYRELDGPLYTIPYEMACYVGVCVTGLVFGRHIRWLFLLGAPVAAVLFVVFTGSGVISEFIGSYRTFVVLCAYFVIGSMVFHFPVLQRGTGVLVALTLAAVCLAAGKVTAATIIALPICAVYVGRQSWPGFRRVGRYGDFSYGVYLWAWPITQLGVLWLHRDTPLPILLFVTLVATFLLAFLSWHLVEKRALRLKPSAGGSVERSAWDSKATSGAR